MCAGWALAVAVETEPSQIVCEFALFWCEVYLYPSDVVLNCVRVWDLLTHCHNHLHHLISFYCIRCVNYWYMFLALPISGLDFFSNSISHLYHTDPRHCD